MACSSSNMVRRIFSCHIVRRHHYPGGKGSKLYGSEPESVSPSGNRQALPGMITK